MAKHTKVPKKKRGICTIKKMAAGKTKSQARIACDVGVATAYPGKGKHKRVHRDGKGRKGKRGGDGYCPGPGKRVPVAYYVRSCPHKRCKHDAT